MSSPALTFPHVKELGLFPQTLKNMEQMREYLLPKFPNLKRIICGILLHFRGGGTAE